MKEKERRLPANVFDPDKKNVFDEIADSGMHVTPRKRKRNVAAAESVAVAVLVPNDIAAKIRFIRAIEKRPFKDIVADVLCEYVRKYEEENGELDESLFFARKKTEDNN